MLIRAYLAIRLQCSQSLNGDYRPVVDWINRNVDSGLAANGAAIGNGKGETVTAVIVEIGCISGHPRTGGKTDRALTGLACGRQLVAETSIST